MRLGDRIRIEMLDIMSLVPCARNAKKHPQEQVAKIAGSIREFGFNAPVLIAKDKTIVAGHGRVLAAQMLGLERVPCVVLDHLDDIQRRAYMLADNRLGDTALAPWDVEILSLEVQALEADGFDVGSIGFDELGLQEIADSCGAGTGNDTRDTETEDTEPQIDRAEELRKEWRVETGQLWQLGEHRILCGDSTKTDDVDRVMAGEKADCVFADPPYGMDLDPRYDAMHTDDRHRKTGNRFARVIGDAGPFDVSPVMRLLETIDDQFWWGADYYREHLPTGGSWYVWDKRSNDSCMDLDPVVGSAFELCWSKQKHRREIARILWSGYHGMRGADKGVRVHPTQKPIALVSWFMERFPMRDVIDPFSGSGTTIIACENLGRKCRAIEISPGYVAVALQRWSDHTGKTPELVK